MRNLKGKASFFQLKLKKIIHEQYEQRGFLGSSGVKNPTAMQETWLLSLGWEDPLEKEMATHSSILAWEIPWTEELVIL